MNRAVGQDKESPLAGLSPQGSCSLIVITPLHWPVTVLSVFHLLPRCILATNLRQVLLPAFYTDEETEAQRIKQFA